MRRLIIVLVPLLAVVFLLNSCSSMKVTDFENKEPRFIFENFFSGKVEGTGQFWNRFKNLSVSFTVTTEGKWDGKELVLDEQLVYDTGEKFFRKYNIKKIDDNNYEVTSADLVGVGKIRSYGNAVKWSYYLNQKIGDKIVKLYFDDWMFLQSNGLVLNRAFAQKFGFGVGEVIMSLKKN